MVSSVRDMGLSAFGSILESFVPEVQGLLAAVIVDDQGETVDYTGSLDPYDIRILAAEAQLLVRAENAGIVRMTIFGAKKHIAVLRLFEGYLLVVATDAYVEDALCELALESAAYELAAEAGYERPPSWRRMHIALDANGLPRSLSGQPLTVEYIGYWVDRRYVRVVAKTLGSARYEFARLTGPNSRYYGRPLSS